MISDRLYEMLLLLPRRNLLNLMLMALDEMQAYNGKSRGAAIMEALCAEYVPDKGYKIPSLKIIKKLTNSTPL